MSGHPDEKKIAKEMHELSSLEKKEREMLHKAHQYCKEARREFDKAGDICAFGTDASRRTGMVAISQPGLEKNKHQLLKHLDRSQKHLLDMQRPAKKLITPAKRLEQDLLDLREATHEKKAEKLTDEEYRILQSAQKIETHIQQLVDRLKAVSKSRIDDLKNTGYLDAADPDLGRWVREQMLAIHQELEELQNLLGDMEELEQEIARQTAEYVHE